MMYPFTRVAMPQRTPFTQGCRYLLSLLIAACFLVGCGKSSDVSHPPTPDSQLLTPNVSPSLRLHWLGKKRLSAESNATNFISIWNLPESVRLENQTLDKLSTAPWRLLATSVTLSNAPTALLRPLLNDVVQEETYLEVLSGTNQPYEAVLAIKLPPDRAALWQANLPTILKSLSSSLPPISYLQSSNASFTLTNIGNWTILSISEIRHQASKLSILPQIRQRLAATGIPFVQDTTNDWINGRVDFSWLSRTAGWSVRSDLPVFEFSAIGDAGNVKTLARLTFPSQVAIELEPWNIPTNLVHDPLTGFMAVRGISPALQSYHLWNESKLGDTPTQAVFWSQSGNPALRFFAFPSRNSSNQMRLVSEFLLKDINPIMAVFPNITNFPIGSFEQVPGGQRLKWRGIPYIFPGVDTVDLPSGSFIAGGLFPNRITNTPAPETLLAQFKSDSDIILYDWEASQATSYALIQVSQTTRFVFGLNRLSITNHPALPWIVAISPKLGASSTTARLSTPTLVSFKRTSTIGLTGIELHLLAEWLESPDFPAGIFSINSKPGQQSAPRSGTH